MLFNNIKEIHTIAFDVCPSSFEIGKDFCLDLKKSYLYNKNVRSIDIHDGVLSQKYIDNILTKDVKISFVIGGLRIFEHDLKADTCLFPDEIIIPFKCIYYHDIKISIRAENDIFVRQFNSLMFEFNVTFVDLNPDFENSLIFELIGIQVNFSNSEFNFLRIGSGMACWQFSQNRQKIS
jgi:hypothetical protein